MARDGITVKVNFEAKTFEEIRKKIAALKNERDRLREELSAAMADMKEISQRHEICEFCKFDKADADAVPCAMCADGVSRFEWRGIVETDGQRKSCDGCAFDLGGGVCRLSAEGECREGGGYELYDTDENDVYR